VNEKGDKSAKQKISPQSNKNDNLETAPRNSKKFEREFEAIRAPECKHFNW
jgi:hypothetical protein